MSYHQNEQSSFPGCLFKSIILIVFSCWGQLKTFPIYEALISPIMRTSSADQGHCDRSCQILTNQLAQPMHYLGLSSAWAPPIQRRNRGSKYSCWHLSIIYSWVWLHKGTLCHLAEPTIMRLWGQDRYRHSYWCWVCRPADPTLTNLKETLKSITSQPAEKHRFWFFFLQFKTFQDVHFHICNYHVSYVLGFGIQSFHVIPYMQSQCLYMDPTPQAKREPILWIDLPPRCLGRWPMPLVRNKWALKLGASRTEAFLTMFDDEWPENKM